MTAEHCIVVGAGLAGASAAWHLTQRGHAVTVLERSTPAHDGESSHGSARIFRYAYPEQLYADLVVRARRAWTELQRQSGRELLTVTGCVDSGDLRAPGELAAVLDRAGVEHEVLSAAAAEGRWPQFQFSGPVLHQPGAGVLDPAGSVEAMLELAGASGRCRLLDDWRVAGLERIRNGWRVRSHTGETVEGSRVVVAAGGWLPRLLDGAGLPSHFTRGMPALEVRQEEVFHFPYRASAPAASWPAFICADSEMLAYGLPGGRDANFAGFKVARFNGGRVIGSAEDQDQTIDPAGRATLVDYVSRHIPGVVPEPYAEVTCLFTNTPTEDFVVDVSDGVVVISACSGHGAKFAPLLGEWVADLALGTGTVPDAFRLGGTV